MTNIWLFRLRDCESTLCFVIIPQQKCFENDGVRYQSGDFHSLQRFHNTMTSLMRHHNIDYVEIKQLNNRCEFVKNIIKKKWKKL